MTKRNPEKTPLGVSVQVKGWIEDFYIPPNDLERAQNFISQVPLGESGVVGEKSDVLCILRCCWLYTAVIMGYGYK